MRTQTAEAPIRAAVYQRVSSDEQREKESILTQSFLVDRYLTDHPDLEVHRHHCYLDDGVSGSVPLAKRPEGRRLVQDAMAGHFTQVLVTREDRLGRDAIDLLQARALLQGLGIELVGIAESLDDYVTFGVKAVVSDHEKRRFLERSAEGMERIVRAGYFPGGIVSLGYVVAGQKPHQRLMPSDILLWQKMTEADIVRWIFDRLAIDRWSCPRIARELNAMGVPTSYAKDRRCVRGAHTQGIWRSGRIINMVNNPVYRGEYVYGKRGGTRLISVTVPPLVTDEIWQAAHDTLKANHIMAKNTTRLYLLRTLITCGNCGHHYSGAWHRNGVQYRCNGIALHRYEKGERCRAKGIKGELLEKPIRADLERFLRDPGGVVDELLRELEETSLEPPEVVRRAQLEGALSERQAERQRLLRVFLKGTITEGEFETERAEIDTAISTLQNALSELEPVEAPDYIHVAAADVLEQLNKLLDEGLTDEQWQEVARILIKRVTVHTTIREDGKKEVRAEVTYRFPGFVPTNRGRDTMQLPILGRRPMTLTDATPPPDESDPSTENRLEEYREKRDFDLTPEPAGGTAAARAERPFFCVQKHAASRLHYDVRLEVHGVLKSWAVPKGPSPDPTEKRLAVMVEDHPLEYGDFEGTIPEGEYGGGTVLLWDVGWWEPDLARRKPVKAARPDAPSAEVATLVGATESANPGRPPDPEADLASGELKFILHGEKLRGSYTLVQMKGRGDKNWLMIKHRDDDAHLGLDLTQEAPLSVSSGRSIEEIAEDASSGAG